MKSLKRFFADTRKYLKYTVISAKANLKSEVADSYLNWIWWILEPLCFMGIYALVFGVFFGKKEEYLICFLMVGISLWDFFSRTMKNSVRVVKNNKSIVSKVYLPKHILIFVRIGVNGFKMLISLAITVVTMIIFRVPVSWRLVLVIPIILILLMLSFGLGCILMHFGVYVADLNNVVDIVLKMLFYVTGVFYSVSKRIPAPHGQLLTKLNPMAYLIDALRDVLLYKTTPDLWVMLAWFAVGVILSVLGINLVYKNENSYVKSI